MKKEKQKKHSSISIADKSFFFIVGLLSLTATSILFDEIEKRDNLSKTKERLRFFNPVITKGLLGNKKVDWVGRDKPLTEAQLNYLFNKNIYNDKIFSEF